MNQQAIESKAALLRSQFSEQECLRAFSPTAAVDYAEAFIPAVTSTASPASYTVAVLSRAYSNALPVILRCLIGYYFELFDDGEGSEAEVDAATKVINRNPRLLSLHMATLMLFFCNLYSCEYEIVGKPTPRRIIQLLMKKAPSLSEYAWGVIHKAREEEAHRQLEQYEATAITWQQYCIARGIPAISAADYLDRLVEDSRRLRFETQTSAR